MFPAGEARASGLAITSLVLGIFFFILPAAILGVILGHIARAQIRDSAGRIKGAGMATAGLVLGYVGVSIIPVLIIAAIAIPNLLRAKMAANESSAVGSLRTLVIAAAQFHVNHNRYPDALENLGPANGGKSTEQRADLIDAPLASGRKSGYLFLYRSVDSGYIINADPITAGTTGARHFFTDQTGVILSERDRPADAHSPPTRLSQFCEPRNAARGLSLP
jgi:type II secretory pathway pseudopilin PulG